MAKVKIELPEKFLFQTNDTVRVSDINYGNHLGHDALISLLHEARVRFLKKYGFSELNVFGLGLILAEITVQYKAESFLGDSLDFFLSPRDFTAKTFEIVYLVRHAETQKEVARGITTMIWFDYQTRKVANMPAEILSIWQEN